MKSILLWAALVVLLPGCGSHTEKAATDDLASLSAEQKSALDRANKDPLFQDTDIGLWVRGDTVVGILNSINSIPQANRTVILQITGETNRLVDEPAYYAELEDFASDRVIGSLTSINAKWTNAGQLAFSADLAVSGALKIHAYANNFATGGHVPVQATSSASINGTIGFLMDNNSHLSVNFNLLPSPIKVSLSTGIADKKEVCWRIEAFGNEIGKDCKTLWQYDIPINIQHTDIIRTDNTIVIPVEINLPEEVRLQQDVLGTKFDKLIHVSARPKDFRADALGLALRVAVEIDEIAKN